MSQIDEAHAGMEAAPADALLRLRFYEAMAESELIVLLDAEPLPGAAAVPALFPTDDGTLALAFDSEERLALFAEGGAPYAALPGRALVELLAAEGLGLGLNLSVAPSEFLMPPEAVRWLAGVLAEAPLEVTGLPQAVFAPELPESLLAALDRKLARAGGLADHALLVGTGWGAGAQAGSDPAGPAPLGHQGGDRGERGLLLVFVDARAGAEPALAQAAGEALRFSGLEDRAPVLDVAFLTGSDPSVARIAAAGLRFDLPPPEAEQALTRPIPPGSDPKKPPRLR